MSKFSILTPITITDAMLTSSSIAEPAAGETAWVSAGTYVIGDLRIRTTTHRVYKCILGHTGRTALPEDDPSYWEDTDPTVKWAPFDTYVSTAATGTSPLNYVISPGFFTDISAYGMVGDSLSIVVKDGPGGAVIDTRSYSLYEESFGLYEYLFSEHQQKTKIVASGFPINPTAEVTLSITGAGAVGLGMCNFGQLKNVVGDWGGTQYGSSVEPITYSRIVTDSATGKTSIKRGPAATGMRATVMLPIADANYALQAIQTVLDVPVSVIGSDAIGYEGLNVFGLLNASMTYATPGLVSLSINVKGMI